MDMGGKQAVYEALDSWGIPYETWEHPAVFTIEAMRQLELPPEVTVAKNLFLRDAKGKRHFLLVVDTDRRVDLRALAGMLGSTKLSFASEDRLMRYLGLSKGAVSPLGLLNDTEVQVQLYVDGALESRPLIGVHPNDNTATVLLSYRNLLAFVTATGHAVHPLHFSDEAQDHPRDEV